MKAYLDDDIVVTYNIYIQMTVNYDIVVTDITNFNLWYCSHWYKNNVKL